MIFSLCSRCFCIFCICSTMVVSFPISSPPVVTALTPPNKQQSKHFSPPPPALSQNLSPTYSSAKSSSLLNAHSCSLPINTQSLHIARAKSGIDFQTVQALSLAMGESHSALIFVYACSRYSVCFELSVCSSGNVHDKTVCFRQSTMSELIMRFASQTCM
jgi:hypothetical protein